MAATNTALITTNPESLARILEAALPELKRVAPRYVKVERLVALAIEAKMRNPLLASCSPVSVLNFCKKCAEVGTDRVGAGGMWAVPFRNSKTHTFEMVPIADWRLLVEKAKKAKCITHCTAEAVYEQDEFSYERGLNPNLIHRPALSNRGQLRAVYCVYTLPDGSRDFVVMDWESDIVPIRDRTNAWKAWVRDKISNPWVTDPAEQAKKTVVKRALKIFEGASIELTSLLDADNVVNGYADMAIPEPIAMPKLVETETVKPTLPEPESAPEPEPEAETQAETVVGVIETVTTKTGKKKDGSGWTKYGVKVAGEWYGTFDPDLGKVADGLQGQLIWLEWEADGEYKTVTGITLVPREPGDDEEVA